uniref:bifunctional hydroxymethylpyrimidine kinase/phosphomethylpyrimidine kinase n=1 Tax=Nocardia farcinica TaxID=37329 RepID=UPI0024542B91
PATTSQQSTARRSPPATPPGGGHTRPAPVACALAHGYPVPEAVAFGKEWTRRCLAAAYDLGAGHGPVSPLWRLHRS